MLNPNQHAEVNSYFNQVMSKKLGRTLQGRLDQNVSKVIDDLGWDVATCKAYIDDAEPTDQKKDLFIKPLMVRWMMDYDGQGNPKGEPEQGEQQGEEQGEAQGEQGQGEAQGEQQGEAEAKDAEAQEEKDGEEKEMTPQERFAQKMKELQEEAERKAKMAEEELKQALEEQKRKEEEEKKGQEPIKHKMYDYVKFWVEHNKPVLLVGPAGSGKTYICSQIAEELGREFYMNTSIQDSVDVLGYERANGTFKQTEIYKAMKASQNPELKGSVYCADEFDGYEPNALLATNSISANNYATFGNEEFVRAGKNFAFIATANTFGTGADMKYSGRNQLDAATLNRFVKIYIDYDPKVEERLSNDANILEFIREFRRVVDSNKMEYVVSYRQIEMLDIAKDGYKKLKDAIEHCVTAGMDPNDIRCIYNDMKCEENPYYKALKGLTK